MVALIVLWAPSARAAVHDFDRQTLAGYLSLRFSSAVPPTVIEKVLAREGFSRRDLDLVAKSASTDRTASTDAASAGGAVAAKARARRIRQIARDRLDCPSEHPGCELDTQAEPDIAINPAKRRNLLATFQQGRFPDGGSVDSGFAATFNGGRTWTSGDLPGLTVGVSDDPTAGPGPPFARSSDPVAAFDRKHHRAYVNTLSLADAGCLSECDSALTLNISKNGGRTFGPPVVAHENVSDPDGTSFVFNDKNWIVTDNHRNSPHYGRTYVVWDQVRCARRCADTEQPVKLTYSDDGGRNWHKAIRVTDRRPAGSHAAIGVQPLVMANGHLVIVYADVRAGGYTFFGDYVAVRSTDGGRHWSDPKLIDAADAFAEEAAPLRAPNLPSADVAGRRIYVAFHDQRFHSGRNDILLTRSKDEGRHWTTPINATPHEGDLDHFTPDIAAVRRQVHLTYRTRKPGRLNNSPRVAAVYRRIGHGGTRPRKPVKLGRPSNAKVAAFATLMGTRYRFFGDYAGIAASRHSAHPIWEHAHNFEHQTDNPTDTHQRSYSASISY